MAGARSTFLIFPAPAAGPLLFLAAPEILAQRPGEPCLALLAGPPAGGGEGGFPGGCLFSIHRYIPACLVRCGYGNNPAPGKSAFRADHAAVAQSVEHVLGKDGVGGSIPLGSTTSAATAGMFSGAIIPRFRMA